MTVKTNGFTYKYLDSVLHSQIFKIYNNSTKLNMNMHKDAHISTYMIGWVHMHSTFKH